MTSGELRRPIGLRIVLAAAWLQVASGVAGFLALPEGVPSPTRAFPAAVNILHLVAFAAGAGLLLVAGRRDARARYFGGVLLTTACMFATRLSLALDPVVGAPAGPMLALLARVPVVAFLPAFAWLFVRDFPQTHHFGAAGEVPRVGIVASGVVGWVFIVAGVARALLAAAGRPEASSFPLALADSEADTPILWLWVAAALAAALFFARWKSRWARVEERRRVRLFAAAVIFGFAPMIVLSVAELAIPGVHTAMDRPAARLASAIVMFPPLLSVPFVTAYAVLVHRVFEVRFLLRKAFGYALARYTVATVAAVPVVLLAAHLIRQRNRTLVDIVSGGQGAALVAATFAAVAAVAVRRRVVEAIDRRFFREQYDARKTLSDLVVQAREANSPADLAALLTRGIDRALHLERIDVFLLGPGSSSFACATPGVRGLAATSTLARLVAGSAEPLPIDLEDPASPIRRLPETERQWLADGGYRVLVPLLGSEGAIGGLAALGAKRSELPFALDDLTLLGALAAAASLVLENRALRSSHPSSPGTGVGGLAEASRAAALEEPASECLRCGAIRPGAADSCPQCAGRMHPARVPHVLNGKFVVEARIGAGGMGVVYRATDIDLGRSVAIKTLPRVAPEYSIRLRREARAMAAISHPNLAIIFGAETWNGIPMLIFEFLGGGTLAERIRRARLGAAETAVLGVALADALDRSHAAGILHRDIKPSNVGYTHDGVPKLLDFGLARIIDDSRSHGGGAMEPRRTAEGEADAENSLLRTLTVEDRVLGTPLYLSPEAINRHAPEPSFDLWALAMVLYESITGAHPMIAPTVADTMERICRTRVPDPRERVPECPPVLARFFRDALSLDPRRRPATAKEMREQLRRLRGEIAA